MASILSIVQFAMMLRPELTALIEGVHRRAQGDVARARAELTLITSHAARVASERAVIDTELERLRRGD